MSHDRTPPPDQQPAAPREPLGETVEIEVKAPVETRVLSLIRTLVSAMATDLGFSVEEVERIELAVDEAATNVVRHAYKHIGVSPDLPPHERHEPPPGQDCTLHIRAELQPHCMRICVIDKGIGLQNMPPGVNSIDEYLERRGNGGLGNFIIRNFMDEVRYDYPGQGTVLTMTKYLPTPQEA
ncbi:MAG: ATP-binding protein [Candidatus Sumerlaeia bacterium]|nr:ATP-binding protein [Candidatus Sumerlaeia bacterium]